MRLLDWTVRAKKGEDSVICFMASGSKSPWPKSATTTMSASTIEPRDTCNVFLILALSTTWKSLVPKGSKT